MIRSSSHRSQDKRPLRTIKLNPPQFKVDDDILKNSYIEKEVKFAGIITDLSYNIDCTNRTQVLTAIDQSKRDGNMSWKLQSSHDAIFCVSIHNIKFSTHDANEHLLIRVPIHEIQSTCFIQDDRHNIVVFKYGFNAESFCNLIVIECESRNCGLEITSLINQCFTLVYIEATMQYLDAKVKEGDQQSISRLSLGSSTSRSISEASTSKPYDPQRVSFFSQSQVDLNAHVNVGTPRQTPPTQPRRRGNSLSNSETDSNAVLTFAEITQNYMTKLRKKLNADELRHFAHLLKCWHTDMGFEDFMDKVFELYGPDRKYLIAGLRPFVAPEDESYFYNFMDQIKVDPYYNDDTLSSTSRRMNSRRTPSSGSGSISSNNLGHVDEFDHTMNNLSDNLEGLDASVDTHYRHANHGNMNNNL